MNFRITRLISAQKPSGILRDCVEFIDQIKKIISLYLFSVLDETLSSYLLYLIISMVSFSSLNISRMAALKFLSVNHDIWVFS